MEGVMMRGRQAMATAVRDPEGNIQIEAQRILPPEKKSRFSRLPFVRGIFNFVSSLVVGNRVLMRSAEVAEGEAEQPSKAEKSIKSTSTDCSTAWRPCWESRWRSSFSCFCRSG